ncbi:hypothetical protein [Weissella confusa]|uniref:Uncharacterized protein n=2 Tax=Weissella confusa TaxID=1583 RepID=A0AAJ2YZT6_WEICO|nr:hypothetical protein [Weissella confusa]NBA11978.1 hypothetical protein [Weissella confusa]
MKTIRFKMTPTEIKAGRRKVFSWQTQSLQATYLAVTEWLCHEAEIEQVIIVNEGLKEQNRVIWRLVTEVWPHAWMVRLNLPVAIAGQSQKDLLEDAVWTRRTGNAISVADGPDLACGWELLVNQERLLIKPAPGEIWLAVEDMRWGCHLTSYEHQLANGDWLSVSMCVLREFETGRPIARRLTITGTTAMQLRVPATDIDYIETNGLMYATTEHGMITHKPINGRPLTVVQFFLEGPRCRFDVLASRNQVRWREFWAQLQLNATKEFGWLRNARWTLYRCRQTLSEDAFVQLLHETPTDMTGDFYQSVPDGDGPHRISGLLKWLSGGYLTNDHFVLQGIPAKPILGHWCFSLVGVEGQRLDFEVAAGKMRVRPTRTMTVKTNTNEIVCRRQKYTTIWKSL